MKGLNLSIHNVTVSTKIYDKRDDFDIYHRHFELIEYKVSLKKLLQQGISNPEFYGDSVYKRAGYTLDIMPQTACLVSNPIMVESYAALFRCTAVVQASDSMTASM